MYSDPRNPLGQIQENGDQKKIQAFLFRIPKPTESNPAGPGELARESVL